MGWSSMVIRRALSSDSRILTEISYAAKRVWSYPEEYFRIWEKELTITEEYIENHWVYLADVVGRTAGYYSIGKVDADFWAGRTFVQAGYWLDHVFLDPDYMGRGLGTALMKHAMELCRQEGVRKLYIFSDPNARGFYEKLGAVCLGVSPSSIEGRLIPLFELEVR
ncbi:GNAT family N-acetyltransferase [Gorillibacterium sp. sgz5001074]|uniref:GNAT family N-acetyltransferase n=1 Tax=Gorillibacterium sp. sgz5001074 TaxID=3446695 RepID=UPI003F6640FF